MHLHSTAAVAVSCLADVDTADVLPPPEAAKREALMAMLAHHSVESEADRATVVDSGAVHQLAKNLRTLPWENLALRMQASDQRQSAAPANKGE